MADLAVWQRTIVDEEGNVIPGAEIEVRREEDGSLATLYADRAGETPLANPLAADMSGFVRFFAQGDAYTITAVGAGSTRTWRFDPTGRLQEFDRVSEALNADDAADLLSARATLGTFSTVAEVQNSHIPAVLESIRTEGRNSPDDGGGARYYRKLAPEADQPGDVTNTDGTRWGLVRGQRINVKMFGAIGDGEADDTAALQSALDFGGAIAVPEGVYTITTPLEITTSGTALVGGSAGKCVIDASSVSGDSGIKAVGGLGAEIPIAATASSGDTSLQTTAAHGASVGDRYLIIGQRNTLSADAGAWQTGTPTGGTNAAYFAEVIQVSNVTDSTSLEFHPPLLFPDYRPDDAGETDPDARPSATIAPMEFLEGLRLSNLTLIGGGSTQAVYLTRCSDAVIDNVRFVHGASGRSSVLLDECYNCVVRDCSTDREVTDASSYLQNSYRVRSSFSCTIRGNSDVNGWQPVDLSFLNYSYVTFGCEVSDNLIIGSYGAAITTHPGCYGTNISGNRIFRSRSGIFVRSPVTLVVDNVLIGDDALDIERQGISVASEHSRQTLVANNHIDSYGTAVIIQPATSARVVGNTIVRSSRGVYVNPSRTSQATADLRDIQVINNHFSQMNGQGVRIGQYSSGTVVAHNTFKGPFPGVSLFVDANNYRVSIFDNTFIDIGIGGTGINVGGLNDTEAFPPALYPHPDPQIGFNRFIGDVGVRYNSDWGNRRPGFEDHFSFGPKPLLDWTLPPANWLTIQNPDGQAFLQFITDGPSLSGLRFGNLAQSEAAWFRLHPDNDRFTWGVDGNYLAFLDPISLNPGEDDSRNLGTGSLRWSQVYATSGTINTSDAREKTPLRHLTAAETAVAIRLSTLPGVYQWLSAIDQKGEEGARLHMGVMAQDVKAAFEAEGLDGFRYGVLCWDEWAAEDAEMDDDGKEISPAREAGERYGIRYDELAQWQAAGWNARLEALEGGGNG